MSDVHQLPAAEAEALLAERAHASAQAQTSPPPAEAVEADDEPPALTADALEPLVGLANLTLTRMGATPISADESKLWRETAVPVLEKYGGRIPYFEEASFVLVTVAIVGPRVMEVKAKAAA